MRRRFAGVLQRLAQQAARQAPAHGDFLALPGQAPRRSAVLDPLASELQVQRRHRPMAGPGVRVDLLQQARAGHDPAQAQPRSHCLGQAADQHAALAQQRIQRRVLAERAVHIVLDHQQPQAPCHLGDGLAACLAHAGAGRVVQGRGGHQHPRAAGPRYPVQLLRQQALGIERHTMYRQAQLPAGGLDAGRGQGFEQHRLAGLAKRLQQQGQGVLGAAAEQQLFRRQRQPAVAQPARALQAAQQQLLRAQVMVEQVRLALGEQGLQACLEVLVGGVGHRHVGRQVDQRAQAVVPLQAKQRGFAAAGQHIGAAPHLARHQVPGRCLAVGLLGGAGVEPKLPGQAALGRQALADPQRARFDGAGDGVDQRQVARPAVVGQFWHPHEIATHAI